MSVCRFRWCILLLVMCSAPEVGAEAPDFRPSGGSPASPSSLLLHNVACDDPATAPSFDGTYLDYGEYVTLEIQAQAGLARILLAPISRNSTVLQPMSLAGDLLEGFTVTGEDLPSYDPSFGPGASEWTYTGEEGPRPTEVLLKIARQQLGSSSRVVLRVFDACPDGGRMLVVDQAEAVGVTKSLANEGRQVPDGYVLAPAYPNPFNPATMIRFTIPQAANIRLSIYDLAGQEVKRLVDGWTSAGAHEVVWDGGDASGRKAASGVYVYRMTTGPISLTRSVVLVK